MSILQDLKNKEEIVSQIEQEAEGYFRSKKMNCAEAVLLSMKNRLRPDLTDDITRIAAGFGGGSASGCICGALAGATMGMGLVLHEDRKALAKLTRELHKWFAATYGATCCRIVTGEHKGICASLAGRVAGKAVELLLQL
jgi:C_GCAxxG_C_C family probable redox protein